MLNFFVQASSVSWLGGKDLCMNQVLGEPVVYHTISRIFQHYPDARVILVAPDFDRGGELELLAGLGYQGLIASLIDCEPVEISRQKDQGAASSD